MEGRIKQVSKIFLDNYIKKWIEKKELPAGSTLIYCKDGNKYIGVDNTTNDCWVEEFDSKKDVLKWLSGNEKEDIILKSTNNRRDVR